MLDEYCNSRSDEAQVQIALHLARLALPVWQRHVELHPESLKTINASIGPENRVRGGAGGIPRDLLDRALTAVEKILAARENPRNRRPLNFYFATFLEPLTLPDWDDLLPLSVRLVFTSVFNILAFLIKGRLNENNETHIYVSINQSIDALLRENAVTQEAIEGFLMEYSGPAHARKESDTQDETEERPMSLMDSAYAKIIDPTEGMPCCPSCKSDNIREAGGAFEFTLMKCDACGYEEYCDDYQVGSWYV